MDMYIYHPNILVTLEIHAPYGDTHLFRYLRVPGIHLHPIMLPKIPGASSSHPSPICLIPDLRWSEFQRNVWALMNYKVSHQISTFLISTNSSTHLKATFFHPSSSPWWHVVPTCPGIPIRFGFPDDIIIATNGLYAAAKDPSHPRNVTSGLHNIFPCYPSPPTNRSIHGPDSTPSTALQGTRFVWGVKFCKKAELALVRILDHFVSHTQAPSSSWTRTTNSSGTCKEVYVRC